jgi:RHS repeat-associated protein
MRIKYSSFNIDYYDFYFLQRYNFFQFIHIGFIRLLMVYDYDPQTNILQTFNNNYTYNTVNAPSNSFAPVSANNENISFEFGINGSLRKRQDTNKIEYYRFDAFGNMNAYCDNGAVYAKYGYDGAGQRTYKMTFNNLDVSTNAYGHPYLQLEKIMFYPNGYINLDQHGNYTKHYYADAARISSKIGSGSVLEENLCDSLDVRFGLDTLLALEMPISELLPDLTYLIGLKMIYDLQTVTIPATEAEINYEEINICDLQGYDPQAYEDGIFWYSGSHLQSTLMVTNLYGDVSQAVMYLPFGQILTEYNSAWNQDVIPNFTFSAKELDEESGMYYFEARYYASPTFISPDPLFEKKPFMSKYAYCLNNPLRYIDPDGRYEYDLDRKGRQVGERRGDELSPDVVHIVKTNWRGEAKKVLSTSKEYDRGTIIKTEKINASKQSSGQFVFQIKDDESREELFKFLAKSTDVEWATISGRLNGKEQNYIGTNHQEGEVDCLSRYVSNIIGNGGAVIEYSHNHPSGLPPSGYLDTDATPYGEGDHGEARSFGKSFIPIMRVYDANTDLYYHFWPARGPGDEGWGPRRNGN